LQITLLKQGIGPLRRLNISLIAVLADQRGGNANDFEIAGHRRFGILLGLRVIFVPKLP
jgi:hypothetical protein